MLVHVIFVGALLHTITAVASVNDSICYESITIGAEFSSAGFQFESWRFHDLPQRISLVEGEKIKLTLKPYITLRHNSAILSHCRKFSMAILIYPQNSSEYFTTPDTTRWKVVASEGTDGPQIIENVSTRDSLRNITLYWPDAHSNLMGDGITLDVRAQYIGFTSVLFRIPMRGREKICKTQKTCRLVRFMVSRKPSVLYRIAPYSLYAFVAIGYVLLGCGVSYDEFAELFKGKQNYLYFGMATQLIFPCVLAMAMSKLFKIRPEELALGFLASGAAPVSLLAPVHVYFNAGDLPLAFFLTLTSTLLAYVTQTITLNTVGKYVIYAPGFRNEDYEIPNIRLAYTQIGISTVCIGGFLLGMALRKRWSRVPSFISYRLTTTVLIFISIYYYALGIFYIYWHLMPIVTANLRLTIVGAVLPVGTFLLTSAVCWAFQLPWSAVLSIATCAVLQNDLVSRETIASNLPNPEGDLYVAACAAHFLFSSVPFILASAACLLYRYIAKILPNWFPELFRFDETLKRFSISHRDEDTEETETGGLEMLRVRPNRNDRFPSGGEEVTDAGQRLLHEQGFLSAPLTFAVDSSDEEPSKRLSSTGTPKTTIRSRLSPRNSRHRARFQHDTASTELGQIPPRQHEQLQYKKTTILDDNGTTHYSPIVTNV